MLIDMNDPRRRPVTAQSIRDEEEAEQRRIHEIEEKKLRDVENELNSTHQKLFEIEKETVLKNLPDPEFQMPDSVKNRRMTKQQALSFIKAETVRFVQENPDYYPCDANRKTMYDWIYAQGIQIEDAAVLKIAFERCRYLGLLVERPATEPQPELAKEPEPIETLPQVEEPVDGWDINGLPCKYTQRQIFRMSSDEYKMAFKLWEREDGTDLRPRFSRSRYQ